MIAEIEIVQHVDDIVGVIHILLAQLVQDPHLDQCLVMESLLIPDYLNGHVLIRLMVQSSNNLTKAAFANHLQDFVSVRNMVMDHFIVASVVVVISAV